MPSHTARYIYFERRCANVTVGKTKGWSPKAKASSEISGFRGAWFRTGIECKRSEAQTCSDFLWSSHCYRKFNDILQQIVSLICIDAIKLYILSSVVICDDAIEISRSMSTPIRIVSVVSVLQILATNVLTDS